MYIFWRNLSFLIRWIARSRTLLNFGEHAYLCPSHFVSSYSVLFFFFFLMKTTSFYWDEDKNNRSWDTKCSMINRVSSIQKLDSDRFLAYWASWFTIMSHWRARVEICSFQDFHLLIKSSNATLLYMFSIERLSSISYGAPPTLLWDHLCDPE